MRHAVFVSYSRLDSKKVDKLVTYLNELDVDVKLDRKDIHPTQAIEAGVKRMVKSSGTVIVALSNNSQASEWVKNEVRMAMKQQKAGAPVNLVYVNLDPGTYVREDVKRQLYIDLSSRKKLPGELLKLAKIFIHAPATRQIGLYEAYPNVEMLNEWRERVDGTRGCSLEQFIEAATERIVSVGLWFGAIFDMNQGAALAGCLRSKPGLTVDLYMPDLKKAPISQLILIHENAQGVRNAMKQFLNLFQSWGANRGLTKQEADRIHLHFLPFIPTCSMLCTDPHLPSGRVTLDLYAPGIKPSAQFKLELRGPQTQGYQTYMKSLDYIRKRAINQTGTSYIS